MVDNAHLPAKITGSYIVQNHEGLRYSKQSAIATVLSSRNMLLLFHLLTRRYEINSIRSQQCLDHSRFLECLSTSHPCQGCFLFGFTLLAMGHSLERSWVSRNPLMKKGRVSSARWGPQLHRRVPLCPQKVEAGARWMEKFMFTVFFLTKQHHTDRVANAR